MIDLAALGADLLATEGEGDELVYRVRPKAVYAALQRIFIAHYNVLIDLTCVDHSALTPKPEGWRFEITYRFLNLDAETGLERGRCAVKARLAEGEPMPRSAKDLWPAADWLEREVWDMFGVAFADRPNLKRLLMYEEFVGHPLRKDYPIAKRQPLIGPPSGDRADSPSFNRDFPTVTPDDDL